MNKNKNLTSRKREHIRQFINADERLAKIRTQLSQKEHTLKDMRATRHQLNSGNIKMVFKPCGGGNFLAPVTNLRTVKKQIDRQIDELEDIIANLKQTEQKAADLWREYRNRCKSVFIDADND